MKLNFKPTRIAFMDFETQSEFDLKLGTRRYAAHPSTRILTCVVKVDGITHKFGPYLDAAAMERLAAVTCDRTLVAHNAPFDAAVWDASGLPEREWFDTLPCARAAGLPGGLDRLSSALGGRGKDKNGARLIDLLCIVKNGKVPAIGPAHELLMKYNIQDVEELEFIYDHVKDFVEPAVMTVDRTINSRGIPADRDVLLKLRDIFDRAKREGADKFDDLTDGANSRSPKQVQAWLGKLGFNLDRVDKSAMAVFLGHPQDAYVGEDDMEAALAVVKEAMEARKETTSVGGGKVDAALMSLDDDNRIRDQLVYYGAHTGRWAGRKLQPHNMPSNIGHGVDIKNVPLTYDAMVAVSHEVTKKAGSFVSVSNVAATAIRTAIRADNLLVCDYGAVEVRCLAWLANSETMLKLYSDPHQSLYIDMGRRIFNKELDKKDDFEQYQLAKAIILGCGYQMGGARFAATLATRDISTKPMEAAGLTAADCVKMYRTAYPEIPRLWNAYEAAANSAVNGHPVFTNRVGFEMRGGNLHAVLPSGRSVVYRDAKIEMIVPAYCAVYGLPPVPKPTITFANPKGFRGFLYGGKITENVDQAICRDLMADSLVSSEQESLDPVLHVHDEIVCAAPDSKFELLLEIMSSGPAWAEGFPILVEGYSGPVWTKTPKGYRELSALDGRII